MNLIYRLQEELRSEVTSESAGESTGRFAARATLGFGLRPRRLSQHAPALPRHPRSPAQLPAPEPLTDEELVALLRQGDAKSGEELVLRYSDALRRYLLRSGSREQAEELYQQTWLCVFNHLDRFDLRSASGGFKAWLFRIATNKINDLWRSRQRDRTGREALVKLVEPYANDSTRPAELAEEVSKLHQALAKLPEKQREVLTLKYFANLKFTEIAQTLHCPLNTALGHAHKGMLKLRKLMGAE